MKTSAIPERVYALCQAIKSRTMQESDLRELLEPSKLGGSTKYFGTVRDAAKQLGLISVKEGDVSLAVDSKCVRLKLLIVHLQIAGMIFQTRSKVTGGCYLE